MTKMNEEISFIDNAETGAINGQHEQSPSWESGRVILPRHSRATRGRLQQAGLYAYE